MSKKRKLSSKYNQDLFLPETTFVYYSWFKPVDK